MRCAWCHNPESFRKEPELSFDKSRCNNCRECEKVCGRKVHEFVEGEHIVNFHNCNRCGKCIDNCVTNSLKIIGKEAAVEEILAEVEKDRNYYEESGGGVTLSGGEISVQFKFALELLKEFKNRGLHTCVETNGVMSEEKLKRLAKYVDLFLLDYKLTDPELHCKFTGVSNRQVLKSLEVLNENNSTVILRCPIIPGINDTDKHFKGIDEIRNRYSCIKKVEIMSYHSTGKDKWKCLGLDYSLYNLKSVSKVETDKWKNNLFV